MFKPNSCHRHHDVTTLVGSFLVFWMICLTLWTVAFIGRLDVGPVFWVRTVWILGLALALTLLLILFGTSIVYGFRLIRHQHRLFSVHQPSRENESIK